MQLKRACSNFRAGIRSILTSGQKLDARRRLALARGNQSFLNRVFQQARETTYAVLPAYLLSIFVSNAPVADAHFVDPQPPFGNLDGESPVRNPRGF